jgi:hypothetical protein
VACLSASDEGLQKQTLQNLLEELSDSPEQLAAEWVSAGALEV